MKDISLYENLKSKAEDYYKKVEISKSHDIFLKCEKIALKNGKLEIIAEAKKNVGRTFHKLGEYENAKDYYFEAIKILENQEMIENLPIYLNHLANTYMKEYNFEDCYSTLLKALKIATQIEDEYSIGRIKITLGVYYEYLGDLNKALNLYQEAFKIFYDLNEELALSMTYNLLSSIKRKLGDIKSANDYLKKAKKIAHKNNYISNLSHSLIIEVDILFEKGDYRGIKGNLSQILQLKDKIENFELRSIIERKLGIIYLNEGKFELSLQHFKKSLNIAQNINYKDGIAKSYKNLGLLHLKLEEFLSAFRYFSKSIESFKDISESISDPSLKKFYTKSYGDVPEILKKIDIIIENKSYEIRDNELIHTLNDAKIVCQSIKEEEIDKNISNECKDDTKRLFEKKKNIVERREKIFLEWSEILSEDCFSKLKKDTKEYLILYKQVLLDSPWDYESCILKISKAIEAELKNKLFEGFRNLWKTKFDKTYYYSKNALDYKDRDFKSAFLSLIGFLRYDNFLSLYKMQEILTLMIIVKSKENLSKLFLEFQNFIGSENINFIKEIIKFLDFQFECGKKRRYSFILIRNSCSHGGRKQEERRKIDIKLNKKIIQNIENKLINEDLSLLKNLCSIEL